MLTPETAQSEDDAKIEQACRRACKIARLMMELRDDFWIGLVPTQTASDEQH